VTRLIHLFPTLLEPFHLLQPASHKASVHFAVDADAKEHPKALNYQRTISPLPISNVTRYKSDSNPNLLTATVAPVSATYISNSLVGHHILSVNIFNKDILKDIFHLAETYRNAIRKERILDILKVMD
jgi:carbamoyl-phosphate synthase/aspartate carbamoyltransferase/dihydroorotase